MTTSAQPESIGPYAILGTLSKGSNATVYEARDPQSGRSVALKVLSSRARQIPGVLERLQQDIAEAARLQHPGIVRTLGMGRTGGEGATDEIYVAMEHVEGSSLDVLLRQRRLSLQEALDIVKQIGRALVYAHGQGVLHRNLKPRNVLISAATGAVKLTDFGSARIEGVKVAGGTLSTGQMTVGTVHYASPEVAHGSGLADQRADVYSLGVIFYEMLTGRAPSGRVALPSQLVADLPSQLDPLVLRCLAQDPGQRYASVQQLLDDIDRLENDLRLRLVTELEGISRTTRKLLSQPGEEAAKKSGAPWLLVALGALALVTVSGVAWVALKGAGDKKADSVPSSEAPAAEASKEPAAPPAATPPATAVPIPAGPASEPKPAPHDEAPATRPNSNAATPTRPAPAPASPSAPAPANETQDLEVAENKFAAKLYDDAEADAKAFLAAHPGSAYAQRAAFLLARVLEARGQTDKAIAAYVEVATRYPKTNAAPEAMYAQAQLMLRKRDQEEAARKRLGEIPVLYPTSNKAIPALMQKAKAEEDRRVKQNDPLLRTAAPAALATYRTLAESYPNAPQTEEALWKMADFYEDLKRFDLAAQALSDLGSRFPATRRDAWFRAGEFYEKKVKDKAKAKAAYANVPASSGSYREAQEKARKL